MSRTLILTPDYTGEVPAGYITLPIGQQLWEKELESYVTYPPLQAPETSNALVKQIKIYPLSQAGNPPEPHFIDMTDKLYNAVIPYDDRFYVSLARVINEEPVQSRDLQMLGMLLPLGIEKGKEFEPDPATLTQLKAAAAEAQAWLSEGIITTTMRYWPDLKWQEVAPPIGIKTEFLWEVPNYFDVDARGITLASFFGPVAKLGAGSFYLINLLEKSGGRLTGANTYRLRVPPNVPASEFWSLTVYDQETAAFFLNSTHLSVNSLDKGLRKNADGSLEIYVGPKAPSGISSCPSARRESRVRRAVQCSQALISRHSPLPSFHFLCSTWNLVLRSDPQYCKAGARRSCQGWPSGIFAA